MPHHLLLVIRYRYGSGTSAWFFEHWNEPMTIDKFCADGEASDRAATMER